MRIDLAPRTAFLLGTVLILLSIIPFAGCRWLPLETLAARQEWDSLAQAATRRLASHPDDASALYHLGLSQYQRGSAEEAVETFDRLDQVDPDFLRPPQRREYYVRALVTVAGRLTAWAGDHPAVSPPPGPEESSTWVRCFSHLERVRDLVRDSPELSARLSPQVGMILDRWLNTRLHENPQDLLNRRFRLLLDLAPQRPDLYEKLLYLGLDEAGLLLKASNCVDDLLDQQPTLLTREGFRDVATHIHYLAGNRESALGLLPPSLQACMHLVTLALHRGDNQGALSIIEHGLDRLPKDPVLQRWHTIVLSYQSQAAHSSQVQLQVDLPLVVSESRGGVAYWRSWEKVVWHPDGRYVTYKEEPPRDVHQRSRLVSFDLHSGLITFTSDPEGHSAPLALDPETGVVLYTADTPQGQREIRLLDPATGSDCSLHSFQSVYPVAMLAPSPTGGSTAVAIGEDLCLLDPETNVMSPWSSGAANEFLYCLAWSPGGRYLAHSRGYPCVEPIQVLDPVTGRATPISSSRPAKTLQWSPCGRWLVYSERCEENDTLRTISLVEPYSDALRQRLIPSQPALFAGIFSDAAPRWSPDGRCLAFLGQLGWWGGPVRHEWDDQPELRETRLWLVRVEDGRFMGEPELVDIGRGIYGGHAWLGDGRLAFLFWPDGHDFAAQAVIIQP